MVSFVSYEAKRVSYSVYFGHLILNSTVSQPGRLSYLS